jgi:hypothetical protein
MRAIHRRVRRVEGAFGPPTEAWTDPLLLEGLAAARRRVGGHYGKSAGITKLALPPSCSVVERLRAGRTRASLRARGKERLHA